jgi:hypothetical protein
MVTEAGDHIRAAVHSAWPGRDAVTAGSGDHGRVQDAEFAGDVGVGTPPGEVLLA